MKTSRTLILAALALIGTTTLAIADEGASAYSSDGASVMAPRGPGGPGRGPGRPGNPGRPGRPGWPGGPGPGRPITCYARNLIGQTFQATGFGDFRWVQREAVRACERNSFPVGRCRAAGCR